MTAASDDAVLRYIERRAMDRRILGWEKAVLFLDGGWVGWTSVSESDAKATTADELVRRRRTPGQPWCPWLGPDVSVAADIELQAFFTVVPDDGWRRLATSIRRNPKIVVREWREIGARLLAAAAGAPSPRQPRPQAPVLTFAARGPGRRSLPSM